ncbi:MAG: preprotein translocase subunit SecG [Patescibacteria group bacterium]
MRNLLFGFQIVISVLLIGAILLQQKGGGLGSAFGGDGQVYRSRRGIEKALFVLTIIFVILFIGGALASLIFIS